MNSHIPSLSFDKCRAKTAPGNLPGMRVIDHCRIVGHVAKALVMTLPKRVRNLLGRHPETIAALHDVGKVSPGFQLKYFYEYLSRVLPDLVKYSHEDFVNDHTLVSRDAVQNYLQYKEAAEIVGAHHGGIRSNRKRRDDSPLYGGKQWSAERKKLIGKLIEEFGSVTERNISSTIQSLLAGIVSVADWIGSDETFFPVTGVPVDFDVAGKAYAAIVACGWKIPKLHKELTFEEIFNNTPYTVQEAFVDTVTGPGLYILEAPMGVGKTEAALFAAYRLMAAGYNNGFFFGLPTRLTSEKIHERVEDFLARICMEETRPKLAHAKAWLKEFSVGGENFRAGGAWFNAKKRRLLHPFAVGTIDQALLCVLNVKHFFVRTFGLAGKVVILDEVHSYDFYTGTLLEEMIHQLIKIGCTVIILSATLTKKSRSLLLGKDSAALSRCQDHDPYPLFTFTNETGLKKRTAAWNRHQDYLVEVRNLSDGAIAEIAIQQAETGACVLMIANTVARAQNWFDLVRGQMRADNFPLGMIHSKFPDFRRSELEAKWIAKLGKKGDRPKGCILVGTQVLEQSIDIDSDFLITEIAPTDMLFQRMGRQWRHKRKYRPTLMPRTLIVSSSPQNANSKEDIIECFGRGNCYVYAPYLLFQTWQVWNGKKSVNLPHDIRFLLEDTYRPPDKTASLVQQELYDLMTAARQKLKDNANAAKSFVKGLEMRKDCEELVTRYSDYETTDVLLVRHVDSTGNQAHVTLLDTEESLFLSKFEKNFSHTARLHQNLLSLPAWLLKKMNGKKPVWLDKHFFDSVYVWQWEPISGKLFMDETFTGHTYDSLRGLRRWKKTKKNGYIDMTVDDTDDFDPFNKTCMDW
ncbi:MAG: CRISPR-associated helicase Cas3' [Desulfobacteraceae bacterium]|jgi:CRISPR-associated endonuclease/helicase Cas3